MTGENNQNHQPDTSANANPTRDALVQLVELLRKTKAVNDGNTLELLVAGKAGCAVSDLPKGTRLSDARVILSPRFWILIFDRLNIAEKDLIVLEGQCDSHLERLMKNALARLMRDPALGGLTGAYSGQVANLLHNAKQIARARASYERSLKDLDEEIQQTQSEYMFSDLLSEIAVWVADAERNAREIWQAVIIHTQGAEAAEDTAESVSTGLSSRDNRQGVKGR